MSYLLRKLLRKILSPKARQAVLGVVQSPPLRFLGRLAIFELFFVFSSRKRLYSKTLTLIGLQPFRVWLANRLRQQRQKRFTPVPDLSHTLDEEGVVVCNNFVETDFDTLKAECKLAFEKHPEGFTMNHGGATYRKVPLRLSNLDEYPQIKAFVSNPLLKQLAEYNQGKRLSFEDMHFILHRVKTNQDSDQDVNQSMHVDTFHATLKGWLYLDDVTDTIGPLVVLPKSHIISKWRLGFEYRSSLDAKRPGSWRISKEEACAKFGNEQRMTVPQNTLVLANTMGFHRRGDAKKGEYRDCIHFSARVSPFI